MRLVSLRRGRPRFNVEVANFRKDVVLCYALGVLKYILVLIGGT